MVTKPQDIVVALKCSLSGARSSYADLGQELGMSASEVHAAVRRLGEANLVDPETKEIRREHCLLNIEYCLFFRSNTQ